ncbi:TIGR02328 family protein [Paenibacillus sp. UMB4589-SE434]|uniref:TIGR02328 family protein n=1 Tax=Paenibacillus sp. UMB4589-SE434 TaxID=3046314 RepID=UPI00255095F0|nr:TIGR02328 family protein [Paenibacillus sp. UMB4589-SE434]MDK8179847.1 TIGR02328 family protein [Paenibacillus sp. UMB4589-SE434]
MRLWHEQLIPVLPRAQLLGQHRECAALRGNGWNKKHRTVDYVFLYSPFKLYLYHVLIMDEMKQRGYHVDPLWHDANYRGKICGPWDGLPTDAHHADTVIYPEHNRAYLEECVSNLQAKGITISL